MPFVPSQDEATVMLLHRYLAMYWQMSIAKSVLSKDAIILSGLVV